METHQSLRVVRMAVMAAGIAICGASLASAQEVNGKFNLPFEIHWGQAVLKPGSYTFRVNSSGAGPDYTVVVREEDQTSTMILAASRSQGVSGPSGLIVERQGNQRTVSCLRLGYANLIIQYPEAKAQPATMAKAPVLIQRIPVMVAQK